MHSLEVESSFLLKIEVDLQTGCWIWTGKIGPGGYGDICIGGGKSRKAHRVSYEIHFGEIPDGLVLDHLCRVRACCNPLHLEAVTQKENVSRGFHATKPTCSRGHSFESDGFVDKLGHRRCRICINRSARESQTRLRRLRRAERDAISN